MLNITKNLWMTPQRNKFKNQNNYWNIEEIWRIPDVTGRRMRLHLMDGKALGYEALAPSWDNLTLPGRTT